MKPPASSSSPEKGDPVSALIRASGGRESLDPERKARMHEKVRRDWQAAMERRRRARRWIVAAVATLAAIAILPWVWISLRGPENVGAILRITGTPLLKRDHGSTPQPLATYPSIQSGDEITTETGARVLLDLLDHTTVRLDEQSAVQVVSDDAIRLVRGALYIESPEQSQASRSLKLLTTFGTVRHVGTRFEVRIVDNSLRVRVRDGTVSFKISSGTQRLMKTGEELLARDNVVQIRRGPATADSAWAWTQQIRPAFAIEDRSLEETLTWLAHEGGYHLVYASDAVRSRARSTILHGTIDDLSSQGAFETVLAGGELQGRIEGERALISADMSADVAP